MKRPDFWFVAGQFTIKLDGKIRRRFKAWCEEQIWTRLSDLNAYLDELTSQPNA